MRLRIITTALAAMVLMGSSSRAQTNSQAQPGQSESLGTLARQLQQKRAKEGLKPVKVYTNDNIPKAVEIGSATSPSESASKPTTTTTKSESSGEHGEEYFRSKMEKLRAQLDLHQRELNVLQQKFGQMRLENYSNPQKTLEEESTPTFYSDQQKLKNEIEKEQAQVAADQKAMDDLRDELRREGGDAGWIR